MLVALSIHLDRNADTPLYQQIADAVRQQIRLGRLVAGVKLPATRTIAKDLGVHRKTVVQAFDLLGDEGWLVAGVGQGTFVRTDRPGLSAELRRGTELEREDDDDGHVQSLAAGTGFSWDALLRARPEPSPVWRFLSRNRPDPEWIRFTGATADPSHFPAEDFRECVNEVFREQGASALDYGTPEGIAPLREFVAERLVPNGVVVDPDQIMIVNGSQQGLDLVARLLISPGDEVLVEEPGYSNGFRLFQALGARTIGVPLDPGGIRLDALARTLRETQPRLLYLMPNYQNPTGYSLDADRIEPLLELCRRHRVPLIEDQFDGDLVYRGAPRRPIKASDREDQVVLLGSFSKILFPGLRLGWLVLPRPLSSAMRELRQVADFSSGLFVQHAMLRFCRQGRLERHVEQVRRIYGARLEAMLAAMAREFPPGVSWTEPEGGLTVWVTLPDGADSLELLQQARAEGVDFSPGFLFFPNGGGGQHFRLSYVRETEERIERGIRILGQLLRAHCARMPELSSSRPFF